MNGAFLAGFPGPLFGGGHRPARDGEGAAEAPVPEEGGELSQSAAKHHSGARGCGRGHLIPERHSN